MLFTIKSIIVKDTYKKKDRRMKSKRPQNHHPISTDQPVCLFSHRKELKLAGNTC